MIVTTLDRLDRYAAVNPLMERAIAFLRREDLATLAEGEHEIEGRRLFAVVVRAKGKGKAAARLETHKNYADIQYTISGDDAIGYLPAAELTRPDGDYDAEKDLAFYRDAPAAYVPCPPGTASIYFPEDAHAPMATDDELHKVVLKMEV
jgi:biofilm protein TabA